MEACALLATRRWLLERTMYDRPASPKGRCHEVPVGPRCFQNIWITIACLTVTNKQVIVCEGPGADFHLNGNILIVCHITIPYLKWLNKIPHHQLFFSHWKQQSPPVTQKKTDNNHNKKFKYFPLK